MRIILLDVDWLMTPYLIYELARLKMQVVLATPSNHGYKKLKRLCRHVPIPKVTQPDFLDHVQALIKSESANIVYATCEPMQQALWALPANESLAVFPKTTELQRQLLTNRIRMYEFVADLGVPTPRMRLLEDEQQIHHAITFLGLPFVLRGTQGCAGTQVAIVDSADSAHRAYLSLKQLSPERPFAQKFVTGRRCLIGGLFDHGRELQLFSQCTLEARDPTGPSLRVRSLNDPTLTALAQRIFTALEWDGLACAEFIQDAAGKYHFLEINPRPWAAILAAHHCGAPLLRMFAQYLNGVVAEEPRMFSPEVEYTLFPAFLMARIRARRFPRLRDLRAYWQSLHAAPWNRPVLMRHYLEMIRWAFGEAKR